MSDVVITVCTFAKEDNNCCICLDGPVLCNNVELKCCKQFLHKRCLFLVVLNGYKECPLCRSQLSPYQYFDEKSLNIHYNMLSSVEQEMYHHPFQELQYEACKYVCRGMRVPIMYGFLRVMRSRFKRNFFVFLAIVVFYLGFMLLIEWEHTYLHNYTSQSHKENVQEENQVPLEYYFYMNQ